MRHSTIAIQSRLQLLYAALAACTLAIGALAFSDVAQAAKKLPEESPEGLKLVPKTKVSAVYLRDGVTFGGYDKVAILDCYVAFRKDWKRDQNTSQSFKVDDKDVERIKTELAEGFKKVFAQQLTEKGQTVVTTAGTGVLILRPAIVNLDISAPDTMQAGRSTTFSASAGQATLYLELFDGVTSELLARVIDAQQIGDMGMVYVRNRTTNRADATQMLKKWADLLGTHLQNARASATPSTPK